MENQMKYGSINGNLKIWTIDEDGFTKVMIYGDPEGLKSFGELLITMSNVDQNDLPGIPDGERIHHHISPFHQLSKGSLETLIGRLDAKGNGELLND